jgi:SAM-dependent methyltransferase
VRKIRDRISQEVSTRSVLSRRTSVTERRVREIDRLQEDWRDEVGRDERINEHLQRLLERAKITNGRVLEIGGRAHPRGHVFDPERFSYMNLDLQRGENTVVGDITNCPQIATGSYDVVISVDVFEHIDRPWLAAAEIRRILAPGGLVYTSTLFSWRYHPCPIDYWRYTPEALEFLFDVPTLDMGFDTTERRRDVRKKAKADPMPIDALGGWRENVRVYHAGVKPRRRSSAA